MGHIQYCWTQFDFYWIFDELHRERESYKFVNVSWLLLYGGVMVENSSKPSLPMTGFSISKPNKKFCSNLFNANSHSRHAVLDRFHYIVPFHQLVVDAVDDVRYNPAYQTIDRKMVCHSLASTVICKWCS